jgi:predicted  nucleic acid-binding Zn-ribbon protein
VDTQRETDQLTSRLEAAEREAMNQSARAAAAEKRTTEQEAGFRDLADRLRESQTLCARVQSDAEDLAGELRAEIKRLARERDALQARVDRMEQRMAKAGLEIHWNQAARRKGRS